MERTEVSSSYIKSIGYDYKTQKLEVEFNKGDVFEYSEVPVEAYNAFMKSDSKGYYFHQVIKKNFSSIRL
jgi:hypothetical protein